MEPWYIVIIELYCSEINQEHVLSLGFSGVWR